MMRYKRNDKGHIYFTFMIFLLMTVLPFYEFYLFLRGDNLVGRFIIHRPGIFLVGLVPTMMMVACFIRSSIRSVKIMNIGLGIYAIAVSALTWILFLVQPFIHFHLASHYTPTLFSAAALLGMIYIHGNRKAADISITL